MGGLKIVVLGVNHAGSTALLELAELAQDNELIGYERGRHVSFLGCGIALWVGDVIKSEDGLFLNSIESLEKKGIRVELEHEVKSVDFESKTVTVFDLNTSTTKKQPYDRLILATGSKANLLRVPGSDLKNIVSVRLYTDAKYLLDRATDASVSKVVIVGGGYIGIELAEAFNMRGKDVTIVTDFEVLNMYYDSEFAEEMHQRIVDSGVKVIINKAVSGFSGSNGRVTAVKAADIEVPADLVIVNIGFRSHVDYLDQSKIEIAPRGGSVMVNKNMESSVKDVYAIGDCAVVYNNATQVYENVALATVAIRTAIVAAHSILNAGKLIFKGVQGASALAVCGLTTARVGVSEQTAKLYKIDVDSVVIDELVRPEFMPQNYSVKFKIIWDKKSRRIVGSQLSSTEDLSLAMNYISLAIQEGCTIDDLMLTDVFFLPHINKPINFITKAFIMACKKK